MATKAKRIAYKTAAENLKPFLKTSSCASLLPFHDHKTRTFFSRKPFSYAFVLASVALNAYSFYGKVLLFAGVTSLLVLNSISLVLTACVNNLTTVASTRGNLRRLQEIFDGFDRIDVKCGEFTAAKPPVIKTINVQFYSLHAFLLASIAFDVYVWHFQLHNLPLYRYFFNDALQVYLLANMTFVESNILASVKNRYSVLNQTLEGLDACAVKVIDLDADGDLAGRIRCITRAHNQICDIVDLFNETFGWIILLTFLNIVISLLGCIDSLLQRDAMDSANIFLTVVWGIFIASLGVLVALKCEDVMEEARQTVSIAYKAMHRFSAVAPIRDKLYILALQSTARTPIFNAAGFFNVDFAMLFTFVNLITTYVIVIIQFSTPNTS